MLTLLKIIKIPGKYRINSKSNNTKSTERKKKGILIWILEYNLSNPDSKELILWVIISILSDKITWNCKTTTKINNRIIIIIIMIS